MKSLKKRFKLLLIDIKLIAKELVFLSQDLTLLDDIEQFATKLIDTVNLLKLQAADLTKHEFREVMLGSEPLARLEELADIDLISLLEERFFAGLDSHTETEISQFLQQHLDKIDQRHTKICLNIQQLSALLNEAHE